VIVQQVALAGATAFQVTWLGCVAASVVACGPFAPSLASELTGAGTRGIGWLVYLGLAGVWLARRRQS
jgi:MYXO-CTERM domain-containing protein